MLSASTDSSHQVACLIRVPTEIVKSRAQTSTYGSLARSSFAAARILLAHEGLPGFYRGFGITVAREIPFTSIQFPLYEFLKTRLARYRGQAQVSAHQAAVCGSLAGGFAAALTTPLDVLKTRTMLDLRDRSKGEVPSFVRRFGQIYAEEGIRALFAGIVPRTLWISAGGAVFLGAYEWAVQGLMGTSRV